MKLSTGSARTVSVSRWLHSTTVLTKNECFSCSVLQCSTMKLLLLFDMCLSKMQKFQCILGSSLKVKVQNGVYFWGLQKFQIFFGVLEIPDIFGG